MSQYPIKAACQCGQVTYEITAAPSLVVACHCKECQKLSTAPFSVTALFSADDIRFKGTMKEWQRSAESGNTNAAKFCPDCGNRVYHYNPEQPNTIKLKLKPAGREYDALFEPTAHVWTSEKVSWQNIPEHVKVFEKGPQP